MPLTVTIIPVVLLVATTENAETSPTPKKRTLGSILKKSRKTQQPNIPEEKIKVELDLYLSVGSS